MSLPDFLRGALIAAVVGMVAPSFAQQAPPPSPQQILQKYDELISPKDYQAQVAMSAHREDGTARTYVFSVLKSPKDEFRLTFLSPASAKGQEMLRVGDNAWVYLPDLKRSLRVANRDSFQGGDFNNADIYRVHYAADYTGTLVPSDDPKTYAVELKAKGPDTGYDLIKLWVRKTDLFPVRAQYFGTSHQLIRSAQFLEDKRFDAAYLRPSKIVMRNELVPSRFSELVVEQLKLNVAAPAQRFLLSDLGK